MKTIATLSAFDFAAALALTIAIQGSFVLVFSISNSTNTRADVSDDQSKPIAVAITPVLTGEGHTLGTSNAESKLPTVWQKPIASRSHSSPNPTQATQPTTQTPPTLPPISTAQASQSPTSAPSESNNTALPPDPNSVASANSTEATSTTASQTTASSSSSQAPNHGTAEDPLRQNAIALYRAQIDAWFSSRFHSRIRGKIPFEQLKALRSLVHVSVGADRKVSSYTIAPTGNSTFDAEVQGTLSTIQANGAELPAPPPMYPDLLEKNLSIGFRCTHQASCE